MAPLIVLPGTLLDGRSLAAMVTGLAATTCVLGEAATLDDEVDRLDTLCPPAQSNELLTLVQPPGHAEHHMLPEAGHLFPMQHPGWAASHLHRFLSSLRGNMP